MSERRDKGTGSIRERDGRFQARYSFTDPNHPSVERTKLSKLTPTMIEAFLVEKARSGHLGGKGKATDKAGGALGPA